MTKRNYAFEKAQAERAAAAATFNLAEFQQKNPTFAADMKQAQELNNALKLQKASQVDLMTEREMNTHQPVGVSVENDPVLRHVIRESAKASEQSL